MMSRRDAIRTTMLAGMAAGLAPAGILRAAARGEEPPRRLAIVGASLIDGNGGPPRRDSVVLIEEGLIHSIGNRGSQGLQGFAIVDARGKFLCPGLIDVNVHLSNLTDVGASLDSWWDRRVETVTDAAQLYLRHGVTTIRDSFGYLEPLQRVRDAINAGEVAGPRLLVAGNILGWGGVASHYFTPTMTVVRPEDVLTNERMTQGVGENLILMSPEELRDAIGRYINLGVDFLKIGTSPHTHDFSMLFSPRAHRTICEVAHSRGIRVDTHAKGNEAKLIAVESGVDLIQHADLELPDQSRPFTRELIEAIRERGTLCSLNGNMYTLARQRGQEVDIARWRTRLPAPEVENLATILRSWSDCARRLVESGLPLTIASDASYSGRTVPGLFSQSPENLQIWRDGGPGRAFLRALEGAADLGMTPSSILVAATKHGAIACGMGERLGTIERGKIADLLILDRNPLDAIANIHSIRSVMKGGRLVDLAALPTPLGY